MNCNDCATWLHAYLDNELDTATAGRVRAHLEDCVACKARFDTMAALRSGVRQHLSYHAAPKALQDRALAQVHARAPAQKVPKPAAWRQWFAPAFSSIALVLAVLLYIAVPSTQDQLADEAVSSHVRSLMEQHLTDVASSDRHTVKPWFAGKLDFSPPVYDFAQQGYPLLGGRLDYIAHQTVAALSYRHNKHIINVFVMPTTQSDADLHSSFKRGYNLVAWRRNHLAFEAVSDLSKDELETLGRLIASQQ